MSVSCSRWETIKYLSFIWYNYNKFVLILFILSPCWLESRLVHCWLVLCVTFRLHCKLHTEFSNWMFYHQQLSLLQSNKQTNITHVNDMCHIANVKLIKTQHLFSQTDKHCNITLPSKLFVILQHYDATRVNRQNQSSAN